MRKSYIQALFVLCLLTALILPGCNNGVSVSYKPPFLPIKFVLDSQGNISVVGEISLVTFVGEFSVGAEYVLRREPESIYVIIRNRERGEWGTDTIYRIRTGGDSFVAVINGTTIVQIENNQVLIDVTDATIESIEFKRVDALSPETNYEKDIIPVTAIKTPVVVLLILLAVILFPFTGLFDLFLLLFGLYFPLTTKLWTFSVYVIIDWYLGRATVIGLIVGVIFSLIIIGIIRFLTE